MSILKKNEKEERRIFREENIGDLLIRDESEFLNENENAYAADQRNQGFYGQSQVLTPERSEFSQYQYQNSPVDYAPGVAPNTVPGPDTWQRNTPDGADDLVPSSTTMQFQDEDIDEEFTTKNKKQNEKQAHLFRSRAVIVSYAIVIVTLVALIAVNAVVLAKAKLGIAALTTDVLALEETDLALTGEIAQITDRETVIAEALANGMTQSSAPVKMQLLSERVVAEEELAGNWFDSVCDFFSGIFH